jgi:hypothetical protein
VNLRARARPAQPGQLDAHETRVDQLHSSAIGRACIELKPCNR